MVLPGLPLRQKVGILDENTKLKQAASPPRLLFIRSSMIAAGRLALKSFTGSISRRVLPASGLQTPARKLIMSTAGIDRR